MTTKSIKTLFMLFGLGLVSLSYAGTDEDRVLAELKKRYPKTEFSSVSRTDIPDIFEVWMGANVAYVSEKNPRYFLLGRLFDTTTMKDLTGPKLAKTQAAPEGPASDLRTLPLADAIKTVRGNGERTLVVFSDPACPYCKRLEPELSKLKDVTIYTFLLPFQGVELPNAIWCAPDRRGAWERLMSTGDRAGLTPSAPCDSPLERNTGLAQRLDVGGTPTLLFADGSRISGYADANEIESHLKKPRKQEVGAASATGKERM